MHSHITASVESGFHAFEMIVVLLIFTALLAIAIPAFIRVRENSSARACQANLRTIYEAKQRWAIDNRKNEKDTPDMSELQPTYMKTRPQCPSGGTYDVGNAGTLPSCSIGGHSLN
jgi:competence protein ComGC